MDIILIPSFGILGAILATGSAGMMLPFYYYFALRKACEFELKYPVRAFAIFSVNTMMIAILVFSLRGFVNNIASLIFVLAISGIAYLILSYVNKGFDDIDRKTFNAAFGRQVWVF
jgi:O-antigen/teichoic acid export membrane protein